jgi:hypothetical protein
MPMSNIVSIAGGDPVTRGTEPDPDVVETLEKMLSEAREGLITGFALAAVIERGVNVRYRTGWYGSASAENMGYAVFLLHGRYQAASVDNAEENGV